VNGKEIARMTEVDQLVRADWGKRKRNQTEANITTATALSGPQPHAACDRHGRKALLSINTK
jgi:hypothetical protein